MTKLKYCGVEVSVVGGGGTHPKVAYPFSGLNVRLCGGGWFEPVGADGCANFAYGIKAVACYGS